MVFQPENIPLGTERLKLLLRAKAGKIRLHIEKLCKYLNANNEN